MYVELAIYQIDNELFYIASQEVLEDGNLYYSLIPMNESLNVRFAESWVQNTELKPVK